MFVCIWAEGNLVPNNKMKTLLDDERMGYLASLRFISNAHIVPMFTQSSSLNCFHIF